MTNPLEAAAGKAMELFKVSRASFQGLSGVFKLLAQEHGEISALLHRLAYSSDVATRGRLYPEIRRKLLAHERAERDEVYRALAQHEMTVRLATAHDDQEHRLEGVLATLDACDMSSAEWERGVTLLVQTVEQHVLDEEGDYFPRAQSVHGDEWAEALREPYEAQKQRELAAL